MIIFQKLNQFNKGISLSSPLIKLFSIKKSPSSEINESLDKLKDKKLEPPQYIHSKNYNFEQFNKGYASKVITAMDQYIKKQEDDKTLNIPRRRRKILANPKYDLDLTNYSVWRIYDQLLCKLNNKSFPITCKLLVSPADLRGTFGWGLRSRRSPEATREYDFEDVDFSRYILSDHQETTDYWGPNDPNYDYANQDHITPRKRKIKRLTPEEFWNSEEPRFFRINSTRYADFRKFKLWIRTEIQKNKGKESFDEIFEKKNGKPETYDDYDKNYELNRQASVFKYSRVFYLEKGVTIDKELPEYSDIIVAPKSLDDKFKLEKMAEVVVAKN